MCGRVFAVLSVLAACSVCLAGLGDEARELQAAVRSLEEQEASARSRLEALSQESVSATTPDARRAHREKRLVAQRQLDQATRTRALWAAGAGAGLEIEGLSEDAATEALKRLETLVKEVADAFAVAPYGRTALHVAAVGGDADRVRRFLEIGLPVDAIDDGGHTALHLAAWQGNVAVATLLLDARAPVHALSHASAERKPVPAAVGKSPLSGVTALHVAAYTGNVPLAELLLARGAKLDAVGDFCDGVG